MVSEQKNAQFLPDLGLPLDHPAVSLNATKEELLKIMPDSEAKAKTAEELFEQTLVPSVSTGRIALKELTEACAIKRLATSPKGKPYRYFVDR